MTVSGLLENFAEVAEAFVGQVGAWLTEITSQPVLLVCFLIPLAGVGITLIKRLLSVRA